MQNSILQKCVDELNKENPDLSYVKGMLETLIAMTQGNGIGLASAELTAKPTVTSQNIGVNPARSIHVEAELTPAEQAAANAIAIATGGMKPAHTGVLETNIILNEQ